MSFSQVSPASQASEIARFDRRGILGTLGLAGLGLISSAAAATRTKSSSAMPKVTVSTAPQVAVQPATNLDLPEEWAVKYGAEANSYFRYLSSLRMQRVSPQQIIAAHAKSKSGVWNALPPKTWWKRMGYTLRVVDRIALEMNVNQVEVISAYRAPAYNANCPGARAGSWHQANVAVDVKFPVKASKVTSTARNLRDLGLFRGGIGGYWDFTHIDARGVNINW